MCISTQDITLSFGDPPKPVADVSWEGVEFLTIDATETTDELFKVQLKLFK